MKLSPDWIQLLLGREEAPVALPSRAFDGKRLLITGAGGSIGAALVEGALSLNPSHIVALDQSEYGLHELLLRLPQGDTSRVTPRLGSTTDSDLMDQVLAQGIDIVIHAAAHKYVPLLEGNARAALINNVEGTILPALACARAGGISFVCVSSDKATDPQNVLGQSKRLAEIAMGACESLKTQSSFTGVRLPNVLGSTGSVLPLFFSQAGAGGPLTVTDKAATRYFISEREAVHEILKSSIHPARGALVIPRTHDPINIHEMAQAIATKWGLPEGSVATGRPRQGDCRHELLTASGEEWSFDRHERQNVALPCPGPRFLEDVLTTTKEARRHNDNWAKERLAELLNANDSLQDKTTIASGDVGDQEALHCS